MKIAVSGFKIDPRLQHRVSSDPNYIEAMADLLREDIDFHLPPVLAVKEEIGVLWLYDGFQRLLAYQKASRVDIPCQLISGCFRDAWELSLLANSTHGSRRSHADVMAVLAAAFDDGDIKVLSDYDIGKKTGVSRRAVTRYRSSLSQDDLRQGLDRNYDNDGKRIVKRGKSEYTMDVTSIGRKPSQESKVSSPPPPSITPTTQLASLIPSESVKIICPHCNGTGMIEETHPTKKEKKESFHKPTLEEVKAYCKERKNSVDPELWFDHYEANGWKVGRNAMKNWKGAVRTWEKQGTQTFGKPAKREVVDRRYPTVQELREADAREEALTHAARNGKR